MRFMILIKNDGKGEAGALPDQESLAEMGRFDDEMLKAGVMLAAEGLQPSSKGARVRCAGGKLKVLDGPFTESKELVAGFWVVEVKSKEEAIEWARRAPFQDGAVELRPLYDRQDFPIDPAEEASGRREREEKSREGAAPQTKRKPGTMRFLCMLKAGPDTEAGVMPDPKRLAEMGAFTAALVESGTLLSGEGLQPSSKGTRIQYTGAKRTVLDGPFTETKELVAGYAIIQVASKAEAIETTKRFLELDVQVRQVAEAEGEIRQIFELEDFPVDPAETPDGWREQERRFRDGAG